MSPEEMEEAINILNKMKKLDVGSNFLEDIDDLKYELTLALTYDNTYVGDMDGDVNYHY